MGSLEVWFSGGGEPELIRVAFTPECAPSPIVSIRGKDSLSGSLIGTFQWTSAVHALAILIVRVACSSSRFAISGLGVAPILSGGHRSPAASIDFALSKEPRWLCEMFGVSESGRPRARRIFTRVNAERKRPGPVQIGINPHGLNADQVIINIDERPELDLQALLSLHRRLEERWGIRARSVPEVVVESVIPEAEGSTWGSVLKTEKVELASGQIGKVVIGESDLFVIKSITAAWRLADILKGEGFDCSYTHWNWSDDLLHAIEVGEVNLAIYNSQRTLEYIKQSQSKNVGILSEFGHSMGGKNFYVLARKGTKWSASESLDEFRRKIVGATIAMPQSSDMYSNFLIAMGCDSESLHSLGVRLIKVPVSQGLEAFDLNPDILLIHGQNIRFQAQYRGDYLEVLNYDCFPQNVQSELHRNSSNSVVFDKRLLEKIPFGQLQQVISEAKKNFFNSWLAPDSYRDLMVRLLQSAPKQFIDNAEMTFVAKKILYETYRFGSP